MSGESRTPGLLSAGGPVPSRLKSLSRLLQFVVIAVAVGVLCGWQFDVLVLKSVFPGYISMKANTAVGFILLSVVSYLLTDEPVSAGRRRVSQLLLLLLLTLTTLTLLQYVTRLDFGIDEFLYPDPNAKGTFWPPGRFAPVTGLNFILIGAALFIESCSPRRLRRVQQGMVLFAWVVAFQAFVGYLSGVTYLFGSAFYTQIAVHTAAEFLMLSSAVLLSRPGVGIMQFLFSKKMAGSVGRRLLFWAIVVPPAINWIQLQGLRYGWWDDDFGILLRVVGGVVLFSWVALQTSERLLDLDKNREAAESANEKAQLELRQAVAARDELMAICNHEMRTPLTSMKLKNQFLKKELASGGALANERAMQLANNTEIQVDRLINLIDDMLDFSRITSGRLLVSPEPVDLRVIVERAVESCANEALLAGCEVTIRGEKSVPITCDPFRIEQVCVNLISNATKYAPGKPIRIEVTQEKKKVRVSIADYGSGVPEGDQKRIFKSFERAVSVNNVSGMGLGLFISKQLIERHGGRIWVENQPLGGANFTFELPRK